MKTLLSMDSVSIDTLSLLSDFKISQIFKEAKYHKTDYRPYCPHCGSFNRKKINNRLRCKDCHKYYSITQGTIFDNHKLPLKKYLLAIFLFVNSAKGISSLQLSRDLHIDKKIAFIILHKIRTALFNQFKILNLNKLSGTIQMDGAYISHKPKHPNKREDRIDRRKSSTINQQCIITMREIKDTGAAGRSYAFITRSENAQEITILVDKYIEKGSTIITDEHTSYKPIKDLGFNTKTVNHSVEYQDDDGTNTNQAESYFSRLRRMIIGQHHSLSRKYLSLYVNEITYRENMREETNIDTMIDLLQHCMNCNNDTNFNGYFQRKNSEIKSFKDFNN